MIEALGKIAEFFLTLAKAGRWQIFSFLFMSGSLIGMSVFGKIYVDQKHTQGMAELKQNELRLNRVESQNVKVYSTLKIISSNLQNFSESLREIREDVRSVNQTNRETQKMVIDIYRKQAGS